MMTLVDLPAEQVERLDRFCLKHDRERDYIVRGAIELLMDVIDRDEYRVVQRSGRFEKIKRVLIRLVKPNSPQLG